MLKLTNLEKIESILSFVGPFSPWHVSFSARHPVRWENMLLLPRPLQVVVSLSDEDIWGWGQRSKGAPSTKSEDCTHRGLFHSHQLLTLKSKRNDNWEITYKPPPKEKESQESQSEREICRMPSKTFLDTNISKSNNVYKICVSIQVSRSHMNQV